MEKIKLNEELEKQLFSTLSDLPIIIINALKEIVLIGDSVDEFSSALRAYAILCEQSDNALRKSYARIMENKQTKN